MDAFSSEPALPVPGAPEDGRREARRAYSRLGLAFVLLLLVWNGADIGLGYLAGRLWPERVGTTLFTLLVNDLALYGCAMPVFLLVMRKLPASAPESRKLSGGVFLGSVCVSYTLLVAGSLAGLLVTGIIYLLSGQATPNPAADLLTSGSDFAALLAGVAVLAPLAEEFICRKIILDRMRAYGAGTAVVVSAALFGCLHGNLSQFFYAFALGLFFGYVYLRTGRLRYTIFLHMIINFFSTVLAALSSGLTDLTTGDPDAFLRFLSGMDTGTLLRAAATGLLVFLEYGCAIGGLVLLILRRGTFRLPETGARLIPKEDRWRIVLLNPGMIACVCAGCAFFISGYLL